MPVVHNLKELYLQVKVLLVDLQLIIHLFQTTMVKFLSVVVLLSVVHIILNICSYQVLILILNKVVM